MLKNSKKVKIIVIFGSKKNWQVSAARNKQDCFLLLTLASFFLKKIFINTSLFSQKNVGKLKKSENYCYIWFKKKLASVRSKKQTRLFLATDTCQFFLKKIFINTSLISQKNVGKLKKSENYCYIWFKNKLASVSSKKQTRLFLDTDTCQFFFGENFH